MVSRIHLTGSTNGKPIPVAATATPGTLLHTATSDTHELDSMFLWVSNVTGTAAVLTLEWGGVSDPANHLVKSYSIAANSGPTTIATGQIVSGGVVVRAFSGTANALNITGYVNRIS